MLLPPHHNGETLADNYCPSLLLLENNNFRKGEIKINKVIKNNVMENVTITTLEIAEMMGTKHYKVLEKIQGTKDNKTLGLLKIIKQQNLDEKNYFIKSSYKDKKNQSRVCYDCTLNGVKMLIDNFRNYKNKFKLIDWYENHTNRNDNIILYERKEIGFVNALEKVLFQISIVGIRQYSVLQYHIDYYIPSIKLAIEYDENDHKNYTYEKQELRQGKIEKELDCKFIRLSDTNDNYCNIGIVIKEIMNILKEVA